mmetsp:Transcript_146/g.531  ORF Transcript_146/g.531 Transcript_146/m.531 type:complete len:233 (-) Transcript_146:206-904(-)
MDALQFGFFSPAAQVAGSGLIFTACFLVTRYLVFPSRSFDFCNRSISILHSCLALYLTGLAIDWGSPFERLGGNPTNGAELFSMSVSLGYFIYDTLCVFVDTMDIVGTLHHAATIAGLWVGVFTGIGGAELVQCLFLMEVSTPFMHLRMIFKEAGLASTSLAKMNEVTFGVSYIICRVFLASPLLYFTMTAPIQNWQHILLKAGATGIWVVSIFWLSKIIKVITGKPRKKAQ